MMFVSMCDASALVRPPSQAATSNYDGDIRVMCRGPGGLPNAELDQYANLKVEHELEKPQSDTHTLSKVL